MEQPEKADLLKTLEGLTVDELKAFRKQLSAVQLKENYKCIPPERLKNADHRELAGLLVGYYGVVYGMEVAMEGLKGISLQRASGRTVDFRGAEKHFVEQHQDELTEQVSQVPKVLERLVGVALNDGQYEAIMSEPMDVLRMHKLYKLVPTWKRECKDHLYRVLQETNRLLIAQLEEEHFIERHQEELIQRAVGVDLLVVSLCWNETITREQMSNLKGPDQEQMRKLYELVPSWTAKDKDKMKQILMKTNRRLMAQLAGGHFVDRHREELVEQVKPFPLRRLCGLALNEEQYKTLTDCATEKSKVEALFQLERKWSRRQKDQLYRVLLETNRPIIEILEGEHFVEKHQEELIHRVHSVDAILRRLQDQCSLVMRGSDQQKMQELYTLVPKWNKKQKDHLYTVLKKTNGPLVAELEEGHFIERQKETLIERATRIKQVVKQLLRVTIHHILYLIILSKHTDSEKMSMLYTVVPNWNGDWKDYLYQALRETNGHLIKEIEGRKSCKEGLIPDPLAQEKCYLCEEETDFPEVKPELVPDAKGELKLYKMHCPRAGNFECSVTKLKFEMRSGGTLTYMYSSWDQHLGKAEMQDWMAAGPLFNIQADASGKVATIHLPLFICLKGGETDISRIKIAHFLDVGMTVEEPTRMSPFHVVLENPTFSFLGVLCKSVYRLFHFFPIHSVVRLYQSSRTASLHLYVIPNDSSLIQAIKDEEEKHHSMLVQKRPQTDEPLYFGSHYVVCSSTDLKINPEELEFSYQNPGQLQSFVEICVEKRGRVELSLRKKENLCSVWDAWLEPEELLIEKEHPTSVPAAPVKATQTIRDHLLRNLEDLEDYELKKFKGKLNEFPVKGGFCNIPRGQLQKADAPDLTDLLLSYYDKAYAVELTVEVLKIINHRCQANKLFEDTRMGLADQCTKPSQRLPEATEKRQVLQNVLCKLKLETHKSNKLSLREVLEINLGSLKEATPQELGDLPWHFLRKVLSLNVTARNTNLEQGQLNYQEMREKEEGKLFSENIFFTNENISMNPLDVLCAVLLCSDSFLQQEILSRMSLCQFALPLLLPPLESPTCTLMLWAMRDIVKKWRPHSMAESRGFREESLVVASMPTISFVRMGNLKLSKSNLLNVFLSPSQQHHNFFQHRDMECGTIPREISDGLVEMAWYFPGGHTSLDLFPEPVAFANLRGDVELHRVQFSFLTLVSSAVFIFTEHIGQKEYDFLSSLKESSTQFYFILEECGRTFNDTLDFLNKLVPVLKLNTSHVLRKAARTNKAEFVGMLRRTVGSILNSHPKTVSIEKMPAVLEKLPIQVDENSQECQNALQSALEITRDIKDIAKYKKHALILQGDLWKNLGKVEKEMCRMERQGDRPSENYRSELKGKWFNLRKQQNECDLHIGLMNFIKSLKHSAPAEKHFFL